ncbi:MAG TPA: cysteine desulfurase [Clostridiales bacterium]|nr:cysteine desulfurase [Clostridiales bacterium]
MNTIYFDNSATTRISDEALETYLEVSKNTFGNPSSLHALGFAAERELNAARSAILRTLGSPVGTLIFTASGSEANNLAISGRLHAKERYRRGAKILSTAGEHASVSEPLRALGAEGVKIVEIPTAGGVLDREALLREMTPDVVLVTMMLVNNETGALYDLADVSRLMKEKLPEAVLHVDATQGYLKVPFTPKSLGADMITLSSHKIEGPKGVGALYVSSDLIKKRGLSAQILGGGQEGGLRSGTENVPGVAAFATAATMGAKNFAAHAEVMESLRAYLLMRLSEEPGLSGIRPVLPARHAPHILNLTLPKIKSETMLHYLSSEGICVSSGSACSSNGGGHLSSALIAFGRTAAEADTSIRVSFSYRNTKEEVDALVAALARGLTKLSRIR